MLRCYRCALDGLIPHEAWPAVRVLIDPNTGMPHKCDPKDAVIQDGKWKGFTFKEMAKLWYDNKMTDKKRLDQ